MSNSNWIWAVAVDYASRAHAGQVRKYTGEPYILHPLRVAGSLAYDCMERAYGNDRNVREWALGEEGFDSSPDADFERVISETEGALDEAVMNAMVAALLHDVVEDRGRGLPEGSEFSIGHIESTFGSAIANAVWGLTEVYTKAEYPGLNRAARKLKEGRRIAESSPVVRLVKLYDNLDNLRDMVGHDPSFAGTMAREVDVYLESLPWPPSREELNYLVEAAKVKEGGA